MVINISQTSVPLRLSLCRTLSESCESVQEKIINQMNVWDNEGSHTVSAKYLPPLFKAEYTVATSICRNCLDTGPLWEEGERPLLLVEIGHTASKENDTWLFGVLSGTEPRRTLPLSHTTPYHLVKPHPTTQPRRTPPLSHAAPYHLATPHPTTYPRSTLPLSHATPNHLSTPHPTI